jgi:hypothetical protein
LPSLDAAAPRKLPDDSLVLDSFPEAMASESDGDTQTE